MWLPRVKIVFLHKKTFLLLTTFFFVVSIGYAQSVTGEAKEQGLQANDSSAISYEKPISVAKPLQMREYQNDHTEEYKRDLLLPQNAFGKNEQPQLTIAEPLGFSRNTNLLLDRKAFEGGRFGIYAFSHEDVYLNLLDSKTAALVFDVQKNNLHLQASLLANRYETMTVTNQFGVSGLLEYRLSPTWSVAAFGTFYNRNPYYSMAAFPFVATSSYGGWMKYEGAKGGIKLGARRYYDPFRRQWETEPIVNPIIKLGRNVSMEMPMGALVKDVLTRMLYKRTSRGPVIFPQ